MIQTEPVLPEDLSPEELADLIDSLMASGTQHLNLTAGAETRIQTVNSTDCCSGGACSIPTLGEDDAADEKEES